MTLGQIQNQYERIKDVAAEIIDEQYDGYKARNSVLAARISFHLCELTPSEQWLVHSDDYQDEGGHLYRVWVECQGGI